jgi:hypothetical protein
MFACLHRHDVRFVLIGGLAATLHGSPLPTLDVDICPSLDQENLRRLAAALEEMDARIRTPDAPQGVRFPHEAAFLANVQLLNLTTRFGDLDLSFRPSGTDGYADLAKRVVTMRAGGVDLAVAALEDVIRSKEAVGRPKDLRTLPVLRQLLEEVRRRESERSG